MYKLGKPHISATESTSVIRLSDGTCIPFSPDNTDYQAYLRWIEAGNTPLPAEENQ